MTSLGFILLSISASISNLLGVNEMNLTAVLVGIASRDEDACTERSASIVVDMVLYSSIRGDIFCAIPCLRMFPIRSYFL
jgi:hypothetical protein